MKSVKALSPKEAAGKFAAYKKKDGFEVEALHAYTNDKDKPLYWRIRAKHPGTGDKWIRPMHLTENGYSIGEPDFDKKPLYNLAPLATRPTENVIVAEGEFCADRLMKAGVLSTTSGSADSAAKTDWSPLAGRSITIWPDNDEAGHRYAKEVAEKLLDIGCDINQIDIATLDLPGKGDAVDWLEANPDASKADILALRCVAAEPQVESEDVQQLPLQDQILELVEGFTLFHSPLGDSYAAMEVNGHIEVHQITGGSFKRVLSHHYYQQTRKGMRAQPFTDALSTIEAKAQFEGEEKVVYRRVAWLGDRTIIDLCDDHWRVIEIRSTGWNLLDRSPVMFDRKPGMLALPIPAKAGNIKHLKKFANVGGEDFVLLVGWILGALKGTGPFPVLALNGEEGSGKSTLTKVIRGLIDPSSSPLNQLYAKDEELFIRAENSYVLGFDNISKISESQSDALCRISTGGGYVKRTLYSNTDETIIEVKRPIILNGIGELATRPDLLSRSIVLTLPTLSAVSGETDFWNSYETLLPELFGALLNALVVGLRDFDQMTVDTEGLRLQDFTRFVSAAEGSLSWPQGTFAGSYRQNRLRSIEYSVEASPFAHAVLEYVRRVRIWRGTATDLMNDILKPEYTTFGWPGSPRTASNILQRYRPSLRKLGVTIEFNRISKERLIVMKVDDANDANDAESSTVSCPPN
jgi:putative DNA primase/helicase